MVTFSPRHWAGWTQSFGPAAARLRQRALRAPRPLVSVWRPSGAAVRDWVRGVSDSSWSPTDSPQPPPASPPSLPQFASAHRMQQRLWATQQGASIRISLVWCRGVCVPLPPVCLVCSVSHGHCLSQGMGGLRSLRRHWGSFLHATRSPSSCYDTLGADWGMYSDFLGGVSFGQFSSVTSLEFLKSQKDGGSIPAATFDLGRGGMLWHPTTCLYYLSLFVLCSVLSCSVCLVCRTHPVGCGLPSDSASRRFASALALAPLGSPSALCGTGQAGWQGDSSAPSLRTGMAGYSAPCSLCSFSFQSLCWIGQSQISLLLFFFSSLLSSLTKGPKPSDDVPPDPLCAAATVLFPRPGYLYIFPKLVPLHRSPSLLFLWALPRCVERKAVPPSGLQDTRLP